MPPNLCLCRGSLGNLGELYYKRPEPDKQKSLENVSEALRILLPLVDKLPYTQEYADSALNVVKEWGIEPDEFIKQLNAPSNLSEP